MVSAATAAPMVCRSPPAQKARPSPCSTSTLMLSDASTSALSCSSFLALDRLIELKAFGRLSVMVAIAPSTLSNAGSVSAESGSDIDLSQCACCFRPFKSQKPTGDNPGEVCNKTGPIGDHEMDVMRATGAGAIGQD